MKRDESDAASLPASLRAAGCKAPLLAPRLFTPLAKQGLTGVCDLPPLAPTPPTHPGRPGPLHDPRGSWRPEGFVCRGAAFGLEAETETCAQCLLAARQQSSQLRRQQEGVALPRLRDEKSACKTAEICNEDHREKRSHSASTAGRLCLFSLVRTRSSSGPGTRWPPSPATPTLLLALRVSLHPGGAGRRRMHSRLWGWGPGHQCQCGRSWGFSQACCFCNLSGMRRAGLEMCDSKGRLE